MVFPGENNRSSLSPTPRNWFSRRKFRQPKNFVRRVAACGSYRSKCDSPVENKMMGNNSAGSLEEKDVLKKKIKRIEKQNYAQQKRLQQLEKLVMQLTHSWSPQGLPCLSDRLTPGPGRDKEAKVPSQAECEDHESDCHTEESDGLTKDLASLMDEFDRNGRENGMVYGVTSSHSVADSDDLAHAEGKGKMPLSTEDVSKVAPLSDVVSSSPLPIFITPTYEAWTKDSNKENNLEDTLEPQGSPQSCFTTPILLTLDALKQAEQGLEGKNSTSSFDPKKWRKDVSLQPVTQSGKDDTRRITGKINPFSNLLAWINQTSHPSTKEHRATEKDYWPSQGHPSSLSMSGPSGFCSPGSHSVGSASEQVHKWSQSLRLPLLSPMPESLCSEQEVNVSLHENAIAVKFLMVFITKWEKSFDMGVCFEYWYHCSQFYFCVKFSLVY